MPNEVFLREGSDDVDISLEDHILAEVARNMAQVGYVREHNPAQNGADAVVVVSVSRTTTTWVGWTPGWGGWPGWGWWGGYPGGGMWYPWPVVGSFSTGTLFVEFIDGDDLDPDVEQIPARWAGVPLIGRTIVSLRSLIRITMPSPPNLPLVETSISRAVSGSSRTSMCFAG